MFQKVLDLITRQAEPDTIRDAIIPLFTTDERLAMRLCSIWACEYGFDELSVKKEPKDIPVALQDYHNMSRKEQKNVSDKFWNDDDINDYLRRKECVKHTNKRNHKWLIEMLSYFKDGEDDYYIAKVRNRLEDFEVHFKNLKPAIKHPSQEALRFAEQVGGKVVDEWEE